MSLDIALTRLAMTAPFIASAAMRMKWVREPDIPTVATDGNAVYYGEWVEQLPIQEQLFCIAHESLHAMLQHCPMIRGWASTGRGPDGEPYDAGRMNAAMDYLINGSLQAEGFPFPSLPGGGSVCYRRGVDLNYDLVTMYQELKSEGEKGGAFDDHRPPAGNTPSAVTPSDVSAAAQTAKALTGGTSELVRSVMMLMSPLEASPWAVLRDRMTRGRGDSISSWARPNRHLMVRGILAPSSVSMQSDPIGIVVDISGSCHGRIPEFLSHVASIVQESRTSKVLLAFVDDKVRLQREFEDMGEFGHESQAMSVPMGGCTDMRVGVDLCQALGYTRIVVLTDGHTPYPKSTDAEIIWAMTTNVRPPFGEVVRI